MFLFIFPLFLFGSMLTDADAIGKKYSQMVAKLPPPSQKPLEGKLLDTASSWLVVDPFHLKDLNWEMLQDIGFNGLYVKSLKTGGDARTGFGIDPKWNIDWKSIISKAKGTKIALIGDLIGATTGLGDDFKLALQNVNTYPELYHLIEIKPQDWDLLRDNVSWLKLGDLYKKGYIPKAATPYQKESAWNATGKILGTDGIERRWIYLKENENDPVLSFLSPSFGADRIASADALDSIYDLQQKILVLDDQIPSFAQDTLSLWIRKIGGFSIGSSITSDARFDSVTLHPLLHALSSQDASALRCLYKKLLQNKIAISSLIHTLTPTKCEGRGSRKIQYLDEKITNELLKDHEFRTNTISFPKDQKSQLLLAFAYAMQPGIFSIPFDEMIQHASLGGQMKSQISFASSLRNILVGRTKSKIAKGELVQVPTPLNPATLLLLHRLEKSRFFHLLALNFSNSPVQEKITEMGIQNTWAIDLMAENGTAKDFEKGTFFFDLPPLSGKVFLFQPKYYD